MSDYNVDNSQSRKRTYSDNDADGGSGEPYNKRRYSESGSHRYEIRLLVQSQEAGTIIGRSGDNIKRLRQDYKAGIQVSDNRGPERIASVSGESDVIRDVLLDFLKSFDEKHRPDSADSRGGRSELRMMVHQSQAGCVIGKAGSKLKEMRLDYGIDIMVFAQCCPRSTDRVVRVVGDAEKIVNCLVSIVEMLRTWPPRGPNEPYDPVNTDSMMVKDYGGYLEEGGRGGGGGGGGGRFGGDRYSDRDRRGGGGDSYGGRGSRMERDRGSGSGIDRASMSGAMGYPIGAMRGASGSDILAGPVTTQQVSIPAELAGVIIGKSGSKIKQIRMDSGAEVELSDGGGGPNDRIITITGSLAQIQMAQYMLQMTVKQHLEREQHN